MTQRRYMTNLDLKYKQLILDAALMTGFDVGWSDEPMPYDDTEDDEYYNREVLIGLYGSVYTNEIGRDHSDFWNEFDRLRKERNLPFFSGEFSRKN